MALYTDQHRQRLAVKPGLTGPMQVSGRGNSSLFQRLQLEFGIHRALQPAPRPVDPVAHGSGAAARQRCAVRDERRGWLGRAVLVGAAVILHLRRLWAAGLLAGALALPAKASAAAAAAAALELPALTLIVPAYNESAVLDAKLRNCLELDYPRRTS